MEGRRPAGHHGDLASHAQALPDASPDGRRDAEQGGCASRAGHRKGAARRAVHRRQGRARVAAQATARGLHATCRVDSRSFVHTKLSRCNGIGDSKLLLQKCLFNICTFFYRLLSWCSERKSSSTGCRRLVLNAFGQGGCPAAYRRWELSSRSPGDCSRGSISSPFPVCPAVGLDGRCSR